jgi:hypothetical protein
MQTGVLHRIDSQIEMDPFLGHLGIISDPFLHFNGTFANKALIKMID